VTGLTNSDQFSSSLPRGVPVCSADFEHKNAENQQFGTGISETLKWDGMMGKMGGIRNPA
jgi:hypothetical protein